LAAGDGTLHQAENIEHYRELLKTTTDAAQRRVIEKLLREEEAKLRKVEEDRNKK
jgi:rubrerythrin